MKRELRFNVDGDEVVAEWDGLFRAYTVNLFGVAANAVGGTYSGPMEYFLGRAGHYKDGSAWQNGWPAWVTDELQAPDLESLVRKMALAFRRDHPRPSLAGRLSPFLGPITGPL